MLLSIFKELTFFNYITNNKDTLVFLFTFYVITFNVLVSDL